MVLDSSQVTGGLSERGCHTLAQAMQSNWKFPGTLYCYFNSTHHYFKMVLSLDIADYRESDGPILTRFCGNSRVPVRKTQLKDEAAHLPQEERPYQQVYEILTLMPDALLKLCEALQVDKLFHKLQQEPVAYAYSITQQEEDEAPTISLTFPTKQAADAAIKLLPRRFHHLVTMEAGA